MKFLKFICLALVPCLASQPSFALTGIPSMELSTASTAFAGPGVATIMVEPYGRGMPFTEARDETGAVVDATITLVLLDAMGAPIANFPREDIWLAAAVGTFASCPGGSSPDDNTDIGGTTRWTLSPAAGGYSESDLQVFVNGVPLIGPGIPVWIVSPDLNGSLYVELGDVSIFAGDYFGPYHFRSDLNMDGVLNLSDVALLGGNIGAHCQ